MIFKAIKYGFCAGVLGFTAYSTFWFLVGIGNGIIKNVTKNKPEEKKGDTFTYKDDK